MVRWMLICLGFALAGVMLALASEHMPWNRESPVEPKPLGVGVNPSEEHTTHEREQASPIRVTVPDRPNAPGPTDEPHANELKAEPTETLETARALVRDEFRVWLRFAREAGLEVPRDFEFPPEKSLEFAGAHRKFVETVDSIESARNAILSRIVEEKVQRGDYEEFTHPSSLPASDQTRARREARKAKKPTQPNQSVIQQGSSEWTRIIRINEGEDRELPGLFIAFDKAKHTYVESVFQVILPYL